MLLSFLDLTHRENSQLISHGKANKVTSLKKEKGQNLQYFFHLLGCSNAPSVGRNVKHCHGRKKNTQLIYFFKVISDLFLI